MRSPMSAIKTQTIREVSKHKICGRTRWKRQNTATISNYDTMCRFFVYILANDSSVIYSGGLISSLFGTTSEMTLMVEKNALEAPYLTWYALADSVTNLEGLGLVLYTHYFLHFILGAMLLLVSMIIVIVLTGFRYEHIRHQDLYDQQSSKSDEAWYLWDGKQK